MKKRFRLGFSPWRCWVLDDGKQLLGHVCVLLFEKLPNPVKDEREVHAYVTNFYVIPEIRSQGFGKRLLDKRCHGVALREPTRLFSGLVLEADPFIADVAWLNPRIFSSFDTLRVYRVRLARQNRSWPVFRQVSSTMETRYECVGIIER